MGKPARFQAWSYTGTNFDQLLSTIGAQGRSAPANLVEGGEFNEDIEGLDVTMDPKGKWQVIEHRDDNREPATKRTLEKLGVKVVKLA